MGGIPRISPDKPTKDPPRRDARSCGVIVTQLTTMTGDLGGTIPKDRRQAFLARSASRPVSCRCHCRCSAGLHPFPPLGRRPNLDLAMAKRTRVFLYYSRRLATCRGFCPPLPHILARVDGTSDSSAPRASPHDSTQGSPQELPRIPRSSLT